MASKHFQMKWLDYYMTHYIVFQRQERILFKIMFNFDERFCSTSNVDYYIIETTLNQLT